MAGSRFVTPAVVACALVLTTVRLGWSDSSEEGPTCKVYGLSHLAQDASLGPWIAKTIPEVIQPGTWNQPASKHTLSYHPAAKVLVVYHIPKVHAEIEAFLKGMRRAVPRASQPSAVATTPAMAANPVTPARYSPPQLISETVKLPTSQVTTHPPKHLFHIIVDGVEWRDGDQESKLKNFTLRYEGEGIIDGNVVKLVKWLSQHSAASIDVPMPMPSCTPLTPDGGPNSAPASPLPATGLSPPASPVYPPAANSPPTATPAAAPTTPATRGTSSPQPAAKSDAPKSAEKKKS